MTPMTRLASGAGASTSPDPPLNTLSSAAQQDTLFASGPTESRLGASGKTPLSDTRAWVGLNPTMPQKAAGVRHDPPVSVPSVAGVLPSGRLTAPPEVEPPGIWPRARSQGLDGFPWCGFTPSPEYANSVMLVLPTMTNPARRA